MSAGANKQRRLALLFARAAVAGAASEHRLERQQDLLCSHAHGAASRMKAFTDVVVRSVKLSEVGAQQNWRAAARCVISLNLYPTAPELDATGSASTREGSVSVTQ